VRADETNRGAHRGQPEVICLSKLILTQGDSQVRFRLPRAPKKHPESVTCLLQSSQLSVAIRPAIGRKPSPDG
jgi:hypothetical protein